MYQTLLLTSIDMFQMKILKTYSIAYYCLGLLLPAATCLHYTVCCVTLLLQSYDAYAIKVELNSTANKVCTNSSYLGKTS